MHIDRRVVLAIALGAVTLVTIGILRGMIGTIFFAITVAYVLVPLDRWLEVQGVPAWWAAVSATAASFVFGLAVFLPIGAVLYVRRQAAIAFLRSLPDSLTLTLGEFTYVIDGSDVIALVTSRITTIAVEIAQGVPILAAKLLVFSFIVFALLYRGARLRRALLAPLPASYYDIVEGLHVRIRETLFALYVIQAATAVATFIAALLVFLVLDIPFPVTLAVIAGILQFLPVVGPSLIIGGIALAELLAGDVTRAVLIAVVGLVVVGVVPDAVIRPRLARETALLPASLYFVGFTGGLLSLGPVGIVAGPLVIVILVELLSMLAYVERRPA